ncbi:hypothetical protein BDP81DRAFT_415698 [Colletotrichum phormii]|uniref:Uncharacterized protein n=1 Tax=Colletotrichum phormii TaxID=359342 RepID=A0AAJ0EMB0_9PEZI|nr:uncharacterized protein BDP81DRAFT_415698 [Colletotrichum phormii]KAK1654424.1 hypothetical protein BDP81DRAFT_415698 [Colletotrichum phormii]
MRLDRLTQKAKRRIDCGSCEMAAAATVGLKVKKGDSARSNLQTNLVVRSSVCEAAAVMTAGAEGGHGRTAKRSKAAMGQSRRYRGGGWPQTLPAQKTRT